MFATHGFPFAYLNGGGYGGGGWFHAWALAADGVTALVLTYVISMVWRRLTTR